VCRGVPAAVRGEEVAAASDTGGGGRLRLAEGELKSRREFALNSGSKAAAIHQRVRAGIGGGGTARSGHRELGAGERAAA
jgi:hypothetical protein